MKPAEIVSLLTATTPDLSLRVGTMSKVWSSTEMNVIGRFHYVMFRDSKPTVDELVEIAHARLVNFAIPRARILEAVADLQANPNTMARDFYGIPLQEGVDPGTLWSSLERRWYVNFVSLPIADGEKLLLVPKVVVRNNLLYDSGEYFRHFVLTHLQKVELDANSALVEIIKKRKKDERKRVTKKSVVRKYGKGKSVADHQTKQYPQILAAYKQSKRDERHLPLTLDDITSIEGQALPNWDLLLQNVLSCTPGANHAARYEKEAEGLLTALLYPNLTNPIAQHEIHDGRKRIDVTYTNMANNGFFSWLATHYPSAHVFVECKNYTRDLNNPEMDQLSGRFSPSRGKVGLILCRGFEDKQLFLQRCADTAKDDRGFVILLDDSDLIELVKTRKTDPLYSDWHLLRERFDGLIN